MIIYKKNHVRKEVSKNKTNKKLSEQSKEIDETKNKKKGTKFSLIIALLFLFSSLFLISTTLITVFSNPISLVALSTKVSTFFAKYVSFVDNNVLLLLPTFISLFIVSLMIFTYRGKRPYSYIKIIIFIMFVYSSYLITLKATNQEFPKFLTNKLLNNSLTSSQISFRLLLSLLAELVLVIIFNPICNFLNDKHNQTNKVKKNKVKRKKVAKKTKTTVSIEADKPRVKTRQSKIEKSDLGVEFPKPIDVPTLSFVDNDLANLDVGSIKTPTNVKKYESNDIENKPEIEDDFVSNINSKQTISLETLKLAKKNVEEKMNKLNNPHEIKKAPVKQSSDNQALSFKSILSQRIEKNKNTTNNDIDISPKRESDAVKAHREKEIEEAQNKLSSIYNSKIRKNSAVVKKKNDDYLNDSIKNVMKGGHLIQATEKNAIKEEVDDVVTKQETQKQATSSIIDEINKKVVHKKEELLNDDFSDIDFGNNISTPTSSNLSSNGNEIVKQKPLEENYYASANYHSTAKPVGTATLVDEKEEIVQSVEFDEDLESAVAGLKGSNMLNPNKFSYKFPPKSLLNEYPQTTHEINEDVKLQAQILIETLAQFKYDVELRNIVQGPTVTMFEIVPAPGIKVNSITNLRDNIAMNLAAKKVRILAPIPGQNAVGVEIPNTKRDIVGFKEILTSVDTSDMAIPMTMGRTLYGDCKSFDVATSPHMLIAGSTGSGKSVCVNSLICSILYSRTPRDVRLIMVDPKVVELTIYNGIPHLLTPVITDTKRALKVLDFCIDEMDRRNKMLAKMSVRNIKGYNKKIKEMKIAQVKMPYIVVIIDEFASLMSTAGKDLDEKVSRLTAMSRAVGIHLVFATQRPSVDVITGVIKNNLPTRVAFAVTSIQDSRTIIGTTGAEDLLGKGDMLFSANGKAVTRMQGVFLSDEEVEDIVDFAKRQEEPDYIDESYFEDPYEDDNSSSSDVDVNDDENLWQEALRIAYERGNISASFLQRRLKIGYNRAARIVEEMEEQGIVGPPNGSKPREILKYQE
jgi:S-DNA-T family DNA segregation ATPase FtsK/SpoIIIE